MKTLEKKGVNQNKQPKKMGQFATIDEFVDYKITQANKTLSKIKNLDIVSG